MFAEKSRTSRHFYKDPNVKPRPKQIETSTLEDRAHAKKRKLQKTPNTHPIRVKRIYCSVETRTTTTKKEHSKVKRVKNMIEEKKNLIK